MDLDLALTSSTFVIILSNVEFVTMGLLLCFVMCTRVDVQSN